MTTEINRDAIIQRAKNEVTEERNKKIVSDLKVLYRELDDARDIVSSIERKISLAEKKISG